MTVIYAGEEYQVIEETDNEYRLQSLRDNSLIIRCLKNSSLLREKKNELENNLHATKGQSKIYHLERRI